MYRLLGTLKKNTSERIRVELSEYHGYNNVSLRVFKIDPLTGQEVAIRKGLTCNVRLIPEIIKLLKDGEKACREEDLLREGEEEENDEE